MSVPDSTSAHPQRWIPVSQCSCCTPGGSAQWPAVWLHPHPGSLLLIPGPFLCFLLSVSLYLKAGDLCCGIDLTETSQCINLSFYDMDLMLLSLLSQFGCFSIKAVKAQWPN